MVAVVSHHKIGVGWDRDRAKVIFMFDRRHKVCGIIHQDIRFVLTLAVNVDTFLFNLDDIPRKAHDTLNKIF